MRRARSRCWPPARRRRFRIIRAAWAYWNVGVPPSGPMDDLSFRLANRALGNPTDAAALGDDGARADAQVQYRRPHLPRRRRRWTPSRWPAGGFRRAPRGAPRADAAHRRRQGAGCRAYLAIRGGFDVPRLSGQPSTFTLGKFGGHGGRACWRAMCCIWVPAAPTRAALQRMRRNARRSGRRHARDQR